jgi:hypothetical protein
MLGGGVRLDPCAACGAHVVVFPRRSGGRDSCSISQRIFTYDNFLDWHSGFVNAQRNSQIDHLRVCEISKPGDDAFNTKATMLSSVHEAEEGADRGVQHKNLVWALCQDSVADSCARLPKPSLRIL